MSDVRKSITITLDHEDYKLLTIRAVDCFVSRKKWVERVVKEALKSRRRRRNCLSA